MDQILFENKSPFETLNKKNKERFIFNFLNQYTLYIFKKQKIFRETLSKKNNINFIDSFYISFFLSLKYFKKIIRCRGPSFTRSFFENKNFNINKKHFFIGLEEQDLDKFLIIFSHLKRKNLFTYNPQYVKEKFSNKEINEMAKLIKKSKADDVWLAISSPKQNILANDLFEKTNAKFFFNVGAAFDFILKKKKEAPKIIQQIGLEWFYRFITDFKYSYKKVLGSLIGLGYLGRTRTE